MTHRELIERCSNLDAATLLERRGARLTNNRTRFSPCPACGQGNTAKGRGICVITSTGKGFQCYAQGSGSTCGAKGSSLDILLLLEGLDPKTQFTPAHYEAMQRELGDHPGAAIRQRPPEPPPPPLFTPAQIQGYYRQMCFNAISIDRWLCETRGLVPCKLPREIGSVIHPRQIPSERPDLRAAVEAGPCAAFPLYSTHPERLGQIMNVVIRPINPTITDPEASKPWKAKCLNAGHGSTRDDGWPLVYGDPRGPAPYIVVEGALDQLTVQALAGSSATVIGAFCANDIPLLSKFIGDKPATLIDHQDKPTRLHPNGAGQEMTTKLYFACPGSAPFPWEKFLSLFRITRAQFAARGATDVNDLIRCDNGPQITTFTGLQAAWKRTIQ